MRQVRRQALELLAEGTPAAAQRVLQMTQSEDERVAVIACAQVLDRVLGKPSDRPQAVAEAINSFDASKLSPEDQIEAVRALATLRRLSMAQSGVIEGQAEAGSE